MFKRAILVNFRKYTPFGGEYYQPLFDFFIHNLSRVSDEYDKIYFLDSLWNFNDVDLAKIQANKGVIIRVDPSLRYYDAYKQVLPTIKEDYVLFLDNDMVIYRKNVIGDAFGFLLDGYSIASIYDTVGEHRLKELGGKSKFCPYFFCIKRHILMKYLDLEWGPEMPRYETLGRLSHNLVDQNWEPIEFMEDKDSIYFDGTKDGEKGKDLGYYHIRSGTLPAVLLAWRSSDEHIDTYKEYLEKQPQREYLRQLAWYWYMCKQTAPLEVPAIRGIETILQDLRIDYNTDWKDYIYKFIRYHGLP